MYWKNRSGSWEVQKKFGALMEPFDILHIDIGEETRSLSVRIIVMDSITVVVLPGDCSRV